MIEFTPFTGDPEQDAQSLFGDLERAARLIWLAARSEIVCDQDTSEMMEDVHEQALA
jgi:hypothetical protein